MLINNADVMRRAFEEIMQRGNVDAIDSHFTAVDRTKRFDHF